MKIRIYRTDGAVITRTLKEGDSILKMLIRVFGEKADIGAVAIFVKKIEVIHY
jgi:hypothetical protein